MMTADNIVNLVPVKPRERSLPARSGRVQNLPTAVTVSDAVLEYPLLGGLKSSIKEVLLNSLGAPQQKAPAQEFVRALDGVSVTLRHGERVGIIGRNGAGKSTFLRALAGIYPLKTGSIEVQGEIGTLLDFTHGFETEATGRENIRYRGLAMGLHPKLIDEYQQQIIEFADIGPFIDLPVRTYSSGMNVRLGFAISTQFAPDILLIDEVFGAGDASFAEKAKERMREMLDNSGLLVMVSHSLGLLENICTRILWLERGKIFMDGPAEEVLAQYTLE